MDWHPASALDLQSFSPVSIFEAGLRLHHLANTAYPIGHLSTLRPYRVPNSDVQMSAPVAWQEIDHLGLYVHIPFCEQRCRYCEYTVVDPAIIDSSEAIYFALLLREFDLWHEAINTPSKTLVGFDIGGGTPSVVQTAYIECILEAVQKHFRLPESISISIETTPRIAALQPEKIRTYYQMGIRRISMGVQTVNPRLLQTVGRTSTSLAWNRAAAENIRRAGFECFNVDVMYGFAGQSLASVESTLWHTIGLEPEYITLYRMRYKGTSLAHQASHVSLEQVNAQYALARELLETAGYHATPGKNTFSRIPGDPGTSDYLTERVVKGTPYLGLGLGAQSLSQVTLSYNSGAADKSLMHYQRQIKAGDLPIQDLYHLSRQMAMGKMIAVSFYFGEINLPAFREKFGISLEEAFPEEVAFVLERGLMAYASDLDFKAQSGQPLSLRLTEAGVRAYNGVIALFYAGSVKAHLLQIENSDVSLRSFFPVARPTCAYADVSLQPSAI